jgi:hypothetical protein
MAMTSTPRVYLITDAPPRRDARPVRWRVWLRLTLAALALLVTAADAWVTAVLDTRPLIPAVRLAGARIIAWCRDRAAGVVPAEIVDDSDRKVRP